MSNLVIGSLVLLCGNRTGRVVSIEERDDYYTNTRRELVCVQLTAEDIYYSAWVDKPTVIGPPIGECNDKPEGPSLIERRKALVTHLANLKGMVKKNRNDLDLVQTLKQKITDSYDNEWFWYSVAESLTDPRKISFAPSMELADNDTKRRFSSYAKFLKGPAKKFGFDLDEEEIGRLAYLIGTSFPSSRDYTFEIVTGKNIIDGYRMSPDAWNSCMNNSPQVAWYAINPDKVSLVKIHQGGMYCGRALLWTTDSGEKVLDRVYPSDLGPHTQALHAYAREQGWDYKNSQSRADCCLASERNDYIVTLSTKTNRRWKIRNNGYPYLDTFKYIEARPKSNSLVPLLLTKSRWVLDRTDGKPGFSGPTCNGCNNGIDPENIYENIRGRKYCRTCYGRRYTRLTYKYENSLIEGEFSKSSTKLCHGCAETFLKKHLVVKNNLPLCPNCVKIEV